MTMVFIDTNVYLDFYRSRNDAIRILQDLVDHHASKLLFPEQVYLEIRRNKDSIIGEVISDLTESKKNVPSLPASSLISESEYEEWNTAKKAVLAPLLDKIIKKLNERLEDSTKDEIYSQIKSIYSHAHVIATTDEHLRNAEKRRFLGNPPRPQKGKLASACDEIIWEAILASVKDDLIIVSRDGTYKSHLSFLRDEFYETTGYQLIGVVNKISDSISNLGQTVSPEISDIEDQQIEGIKWTPFGHFGQFASGEYWVASQSTPPYDYGHCHMCGREDHLIRGLCLRCNAIEAED